MKDFAKMCLPGRRWSNPGTLWRRFEGVKG